MAYTRFKVYKKTINAYCSKSLTQLFFILDTFPRPVSTISELSEGQDIYLEGDDLSLPASPNSTCTVFNCPPSPTYKSLPATPISTRTAFFNYPPSPTYTTISSSAFSTTVSTADSIGIKVIHDTCIILLRVPRRIKFAEVRQRLYNKFIGQEGIPLPPTFKVVFVPPPPTTTTTATNTNDNNPSGPATNWTDVVVVQEVIDSESDWEQLMSTTVQRDKITLRIQDISTT